MAEFEGQTLIREYEDAGYSDAEIQEMRDTKTREALDAGYTQQDLDKYWGAPDKEPAQIIGKVMQDNLANGGWNPDTLDTANPESMWEMFTTGWQWGTTSLSWSGAPNLKAPDDAGFLSNLAFATGQMLGDTPTAVTGILGVGYATKNPYAAGAAAMAVPEGMRTAYLEQYRNGTPADIAGVVERIGKIMAEGSKAAVIGATTVGGGKLAGTVAGPLAKKFLPAATAPLAKTTAELTAMGVTGATVSAALDGRLPSSEDFALGVVMTAMIPFATTTGRATYNSSRGLFTVKGARERVELTPVGDVFAANMAEVWAKTGIEPLTQSRIASTDKLARQQILGADADGVVVTTAFEAHRPEEPKPPTMPTEVEIIGGMKETPAAGEPVEFKPLVIAGEISPETGIAPVKSVDINQLETIIAETETNRLPVSEEVAGEVRSGLDGLTRKFKNPDGSVDLEAILIAYHSGEGRARVFRANGRQHASLPPPTQRFLERAGDRIGRGGYEPEKALVPKEGAGGGGKPPGEDQPRIGGPKKEEEPHFPRDREFVQEDMHGNMVETSPGRTWGDTLRALQGDWRELAIAATLDKRWGVVKDVAKDIGLEDLFRLMKGYSGRSIMRIKRGGVNITVDDLGNPQYAWNKNVPSLNSIWDGAHKMGKGGVTLLRDYLHALDTIDRFAAGKRTVTPHELATEFRNSLTKKETEQLEILAAEHKKVFDNSIDGLVEADLLSEDSANNLKEQHPNYFPQILADDSGPSYSLGGGRKKQPIKKAEGQDMYRIKEPKLESVKALFTRDFAASANIAAKGLVKILDEQGLIETRAITDKSRLIGKPQEKGVLYGDIIDENGLVKESVSKDLMGLNNNEITYYDKGVRTTVTVKDFPGREALMRMVRGSTTELEKNLGIQMLKFAAQVKRTGITELPSFVAKVTIQDSFAAFVMDKNGGLPILNTLKGALHVFDYLSKGKLGGKMEDVYVESILNGMFALDMANIDANFINQAYHSMDNRGFQNSLINSFRHGIETSQTIMRMSDSMTRVSVYANKRSKGVGAIRAANDVSTMLGDFRERSANSVVNTIMSTTPFLLPRMRGLDAMVKAIKADPIGLAVRGTMAITVPAIILRAYAYYMEDQFADEIPEAMLTKNWDRRIADTQFPVPMFLPNGEYAVGKLPMPYGWGPLFGGIVPRLFERMENKDPRAFKDWIKNIVEANIGGMVPLQGNPMVQPFIENAANYDFFQQKPWIPKSLEHLSGENQRYEWTSSTARKVAEIVNSMGGDMSPLTFEKFLSHWTGSSGQAILRTIDIAVRDDAPPRSIADIPEVGAFFIRNPGTSSRPINDFYDEYDEYQTILGDIKFSEDRDEFDKVTALEEKLERQFGYDKLENVAAALSEQRKAIYAVLRAREDRGEDPDKEARDNDDRQLIDDMVEQMIFTTRTALEEMDQQRLDAGRP